MHPDFVAKDAGRLIGDAIRLYRAKAGTFFILGGLPVLAAGFLMGMAFEAGWVIAASVMFFAIVLEIFATAATTLLACSLLIGGPTAALEIGRAVWRGPVITIIAAVLMTGLAVGLGLALFVVPGLVLLAWLLLAPTVVIIEGGSLGNAFGRSRALSRGFYVRNLLLGVLALFAPMLLPNIAIGMVWPGDSATGTLIGNVLFAVLSPFEPLLLLLLYIDMRVRKEAFDANGLAQQINALYAGRGPD
jgi:hypothetical protein